MSRVALAALAVLSASLAACGPKAPAFRAGAPVEAEKKALGRVYRQDGKAIDRSSLVAGLESVDAARGDARTARAYMSGGAVAGAAGGFALGYGLVSGLGGEDSGWTIAAVGLGATVVGMAVVLAGDRRLERAVRRYNGQLPAASAPAIVPWAAAVPGAQDRCVVGGLAFRF